MDSGFLASTRPLLPSVIQIQMRWRDSGKMNNVDAVNRI